MKRERLALFALRLAAVSVSTLKARPLGVIIAPKPSRFPDFPSHQAAIDEARRKSDALERYIKRWMDGKAPGRLPRELLLKGDNPAEFTDYTLVRPEEVTPEQQFVVRPARLINFKAVAGQYPDPHCTYLLMPMVAPFGTTVTVEGRFPHARFFDLQMTPSFLPEAYHNGYYGVAEVPLLDADIDPEPGSTNPFRVGADRSAARRRYRVAFDLKIGNPAVLNPAFRPPLYRAPGSARRVGGAILYQGPGRLGQKRLPDWRDRFESGNLWIRYYAPDHAAGPFGGVPLPKVSYALPDGRRYFVRVNFSGFAATVNREKSIAETAPADPPHGSRRDGWQKEFGIVHKGLSALAQATHLVDQQWVREFGLGIEGKGENQPAPGNYERGATECTYINYLTRGMSLGRGKVVVLTGRLPRTPKTRNGERVMTSGEARYWSLTGYDTTLFGTPVVGAPLHSVMDDEIRTDRAGNYVLVLSRPSDRPRNADAKNGVTWVNWDPAAAVGWTLRWMSIAPEWSFSKAPDETHLGWETDWASPHYDVTRLGRNDQSGFLKEYQAVVHYLSWTEFEALGDHVTAGSVPGWR